MYPTFKNEHKIVQTTLTSFDGAAGGPFEGDTEGPLLGPCEGERLGPDVGCDNIIPIG